jgi:2-hydroxy-6-oxonona-2,4-dienedioate hydrolase
VLCVSELADALARWTETAQLDRAVFLGNSFGCQVVVDLAARYPERIERAVLAGPTGDPLGRSAFRQLARWLLNMPREPRSLGAVQVRDYLHLSPGRALRTFRNMLRDPTEDKLPHVRVPTLVVRGSRDTIVPHRWAEEVCRLLPRGRLVVIPGAAHTVNYNAPLELARVVRGFLDQGQPRVVGKSVA